MNSTRIAFWSILGIFLLLPGAFELWAQTSFSRGEELFMQNKPEEALGYLESAVTQDPGHVQAFLYLGIAYLQVDRLDDAIAVYRKILPDGGEETARIAYNLGNAYFMKGNYTFALQYYTLAIEADPFYSSAYLNRANAFVQTGDLSEALEDYRAFMALDPDSPQWDQVLRLWNILQDELTAEERSRAMAEEAARAEEERRRRFLLGVVQSLQTFSEDSRELSAGLIEPLQAGDVNELSAETEGEEAFENIDNDVEYEPELE